jgi:hypothetical protein
MRIYFRALSTFQILLLVRERETLTTRAKALLKTLKIREKRVHTGAVY